MTDFPIIVIGAGLAGSECAWQLSRAERAVTLIEMRPLKLTAAHSSGQPAELVCSNSFRSADPLSAVGLLKNEMRDLESMIMSCAELTKVPAGGALAVDRESFALAVDEKLKESKIQRVSGEVIDIEEHNDSVTVVLADQTKMTGSRVVIASGPLCADALAEWIRKKTGQEYLYFYDSIAPIVDRESINFDIAFWGSRYGKGETAAEQEAYLNLPMDADQYQNFIDAITSAELVPVHDFDQAQFFEGCLPIEEMVRRGPQTLTFGPLKPVGLRDARDPEKRYKAVVQLRQDNRHASLFNMVGFQTRMKYGEQQKIFRMIPGLENAEFFRMGSMHRNTYICSPSLLDEFLSLKENSRIHFAGQITGCEGYVESAATGLYLARALIARVNDLTWKLPPTTTAYGALLDHILHATPKNYQPMNINFGLFAEYPERVKKKEKKQLYIDRARSDFKSWRQACVTTI